MGLEFLGVLCTVIAVLGVWFNNRKMDLCFYFWFISNTLSGVIHLESHLWAMLVRDIIFFALACHGLWSWRKK